MANQIVRMSKWISEKQTLSYLLGLIGGGVVFVIMLLLANWSFQSLVSLVITQEFLIFAGVVMKGLMLTNPELIGFLKVLVIPLFTSIALLLLLIKSQKDKFYPAMPFLTAGCLVGYGVLYLINLI